MEFLLILLAVVGLLLLSNSASSNYLMISCDDNIPYELNSQFHNNLESLFESVSTKSLENKGFYNTSYGNGSDKVYGRALCRGDINPAACKTCLVNASQAIMSSCRNQLAAIWLDRCQIDYSYRELDSGYGGKFPDSNSEKTSHPDQFCSALTKLFSKLSETAPTSDLMFATGKLSFSKNEILYGLVQCTRDIDPGTCSSCLTSAFGDLNGCERSKGGAVLSRTCNLRFELYLFFDESEKLISGSKSG